MGRTPEHGILQVVSPCFHGLEDLPQPFGISDVVIDDAGVAHGAAVSGLKELVQCGEEFATQHNGFNDGLKMRETLKSC